MIETSTRGWDKARILTVACVVLSVALACVGAFAAYSHVTWSAQVAEMDEAYQAQSKDLANVQASLDEAKDQLVTQEADVKAAESAVKKATEAVASERDQRESDAAKLTQESKDYAEKKTDALSDELMEEIDELKGEIEEQKKLVATLEAEARERKQAIDDAKASGLL